MTYFSPFIYTTIHLPPFSPSPATLPAYYLAPSSFNHILFHPHSPPLKFIPACTALLPVCFFANHSINLSLCYLPSTSTILTLYPFFSPPYSRLPVLLHSVKMYKKKKTISFIATHPLCDLCSFAAYRPHAHLVSHYPAHPRLHLHAPPTHRHLEIL